ncbi:MAG: ribonuclease HI [Desulfovibrio sp.]|jgi:ribonuclease HI|nr:ribonuclease HI [Desulfovibrio sp.]
MKKTENTDATVRVYTDGSCLGNPGPGGWAARLSFKDAVSVISGGFALTTNNRMEIYAAVAALETLTRPCRVELFTDSRYLRDAVEKGWLSGWRRKNWRKADGKAVLNRDLWERLSLALARHQVRLHWVEGHSGQDENEEMDALAKVAAARPNLPPDPGYAGTKEPGEKWTPP